MSITLEILGQEWLENGTSGRLQLDRHGAIIGRAPTADWSLPDPQRFISSQHCFIAYRDGAYTLTDTSTNGTLVNGERLTAPRILRLGDVISMCQYEAVVVALNGGRQPSSPNTEPEESRPPRSDWDDYIPAVQLDPGRDRDQQKPRSASSGMGATSQHWTPPAVERPADEDPAPISWDSLDLPQVRVADSAPDDIRWGPAPEPPPERKPSVWSSDDARPRPPSGDDIWGKYAASNEVDWSRAFRDLPRPAPDMAPVQPAPAEQPAADAVQPPVAPAPSPSAPEQETVRVEKTSLTALLAAAGIDRGRIDRDDDAIAATAGRMLNRLVEGLVAMMDARKRAKQQMRAAGTTLELHGNNPIKFAVSPEQALLQLLSTPERGFMDAESAIEDSLRDLQSHQMATVMAMQGALRATLDRFSPDAIRKRASAGGLLSQILPGARNAALWAAYEREFSGVVKGSDEAFMDVFANEFRNAYEAQAARHRRR